LTKNQIEIFNCFINGIESVAQCAHLYYAVRIDYDNIANKLVFQRISV